MPTFARHIDPTTGDRTRRTFARARTPELAIVQNVLRTPLGSAARDRTYGVRPVDNAAPNAAAAWRQNVLVALARWVANGTLRDVDVTSVVVPLATGGSALAYAVTFKGRDERVQTFHGRT